MNRGLLYKRLICLRNTMKKKEPILYPIGVVAKMFGISVATLRLYETEGLILPQKSKGLHRSFTEDDIKRIACIRSMITEKGLNLAGVRMVFSALPCWNIKNCSTEERQSCPAYLDSHDPCWVAKSSESICATEDCSKCPVYLELSECHTIKHILKKYWNPVE